MSGDITLSVSGSFYAPVHLRAACVRGVTHQLWLCSPPLQRPVSLSSSDFFPPGAHRGDMSDWPFALSEKLSKGWEDLGRFQKPGWACLLKNNTLWHFYPLPKPQMFDFFFSKNGKHKYSCSWHRFKFQYFSFWIPILILNTVATHPERIFKITEKLLVL